MIKLTYFIICTIIFTNTCAKQNEDNHEKFNKMTNKTVSWEKTMYSWIDKACP